MFKIKTRCQFKTLADGPSEGKQCRFKATHWADGKPCCLPHFKMCYKVERDLKTTK